MKFLKQEDKLKLEGFEELARDIFKLRIEAKELEERAEELKEDAKGLYEGLVSATGIEALETDLGTIRMVSRSRSTFDKDALKDYLLKRGVDSDIIANGFKKATKKGKDSESFSFFPPKEG